MKRLLLGAKRYRSELTDAEFALLKSCILAGGILIGLAMPKGSEKKKLVATGAATVFSVTFVPLFAKFLNALKKEKDAQEIGL